MAGKENDNVELGIHETLELHEVTTQRRSNLLKAHMMDAIVKDPELKKLLRRERQNSEKAIDEIETFLP
ncbi:spore coat protein [Salinicoccus cyprini]|uniref:Spore coat protein n=1 Tax=Salinicoccus cyprini TaxID=2493691 RepID=A0A558AX49_9STAP|nr:spore coat protein [Salinicoccus cyprini]TVT28836.1 spore coat protein [Salinicoccus cyprini]